MIKRTIYSVVRTYAEQGNCIIVGRAGCIVAKDIKKALHVRIIAPFEFRKEVIKSRFNLSDKKAYKMVVETDKKRDLFMKFFKGDLPDEEVFDVILSRKKIDDSVIVETIENLAESCGLF